MPKSQEQYEIVLAQMKNTTEVEIESMLTMVTGLEIGSVEDEDDEDEALQKMEIHGNNSAQQGHLFFKGKERRG